MGMRKHKDVGPGGVNLGLIITPMLDMSFQILSFFIMTYHPSALEGHIPGSLAPPAKVASTSKENNVEDVLSVPEDMMVLEDALTVVVKVDGADPGKPGKVLLQRKTSPAPEELEDASRATWKVTRATLAKELKRLNVEGAVEKSNIKIAADGDLMQQYVMEVYDVCKQSGFPKIHFVPPPLVRDAGK
jgi:biopolymer transport protein ExbD